MRICYAIDWKNYPDGEWCPSTYFTEEGRNKAFAARDRRGEIRSLELIELTPALRILLKLEPYFMGCEECHGILGHHSQCPGHPRERCDMGMGCDEVGVCFAAANGEPDRCGRPPLVESRFFIDHGIVHDRKTGKHLRGNGEYGDATAEELLAVLHELESK